GDFATLGTNLVPEYRVTTGVRRMSNDQANAFSRLGIDVTQEVIDKHRWYAFWDAPLSVPGYYPIEDGRGGQGRGRAGFPSTTGQGGTIEEQIAAIQAGETGRPGYNPSPNPPGFRGGRGLGIPRKPEEIRRGVSTFAASGCEVKTDGGSLAISFP